MLQILGIFLWAPIFIQNLVDIFIFRHFLIVNFKQLKRQKLFKVSVAIQ